MSNKFCIARLVAVLLTFSRPVFAQVSSVPATGDNLTAKVDELFAAWNKSDSPGCAIAIRKDGQLLYEKGYGGALSPAALDLFKLYDVIGIKFIRDSNNRIVGFVPQDGGARDINFLRVENRR